MVSSVRERKGLQPVHACYASSLFSASRCILTPDVLRYFSQTRIPPPLPPSMPYAYARASSSRHRVKPSRAHREELDTAVECMAVTHSLTNSQNQKDRYYVHAQECERSNKTKSDCSMAFHHTRFVCGRFIRVNRSVRHRDASQSLKRTLQLFQEPTSAFCTEGPNTNRFAVYPIYDNVYSIRPLPSMAHHVVRPPVWTCCWRQTVELVLH